MRGLRRLGRVAGLVGACAAWACSRSALRYEARTVETPRAPIPFVIDTLGDREGVAAHLRTRSRAEPSAYRRVYELCSRREETAGGAWLVAGECRCLPPPDGAGGGSSEDPACAGVAEPRVPFPTPSCDLGAADPRQVAADAIELDLSARSLGVAPTPSARIRSSEVVVATVEGDAALQSAKSLLLWSLRDPLDARAGGWLSDAVAIWRRVLDADALALESSSVESPRAFVAAYDLALAWRLFGQADPDASCSATSDPPRNLWRAYAAVALLMTPLHYQGSDALANLDHIDPGQLSFVSATFPGDSPGQGPTPAMLEPAAAPGEPRSAHDLARAIYVRRWDREGLVPILQEAARVVNDSRGKDGPVAATASVLYRLAAQRTIRVNGCRRLLDLAHAPDACGPGRNGTPVYR